MKLRVIIADDERIARQRLQKLLDNERDVKVVAECADGAATLRAVQRHSPDLLLLDIQMPGMDGFDVVEAIDPAVMPVIIFITAFDKHAVHAFETCALDYLLKPVAPERLSKALGRAREYLKDSAALLKQKKPDDLSARYRRFSVRSGQRTSFVAPEQIDWIEADGNYAILHVGERNHLLRKTMSTLEAELPESTFARVSRSAIVHLTCVKQIQTGPGGHHFAILSYGQRVPITRSIREIGARLRAAS